MMHGCLRLRTRVHLVLKVQKETYMIFPSPCIQVTLGARSANSRLTNMSKSWGVMAGDPLHTSASSLDAQPPCTACVHTDLKLERPMYSLLYKFGIVCALSSMCIYLYTRHIAPKRKLCIGSSSNLTHKAHARLHVYMYIHV